MPPLIARSSSTQLHSYVLTVNQPVRNHVLKMDIPTTISFNLAGIVGHDLDLGGSGKRLVSLSERAPFRDMGKVEHRQAFSAVVH